MQTAIPSFLFSMRDIVKEKGVIIKMKTKYRRATKQCVSLLLAFVMLLAAVPAYASSKPETGDPGEFTAELVQMENSGENSSGVAREDEGEIKISEENHVASIGDQYYDSLTDAVSSLKDGETLKLERDIDCSDVLTFTANDVTLDLNGRKLNMSVTGENSLTYSVEVSGGKLTIDDSSEGGTISFGGMNGILISGENTKFELKNGILTDLADGGTYASISMQASGGSFTISGGTVEGRVKISNGDANGYITGGKIETMGSSSLALHITAGKITMNGGTILSGDKVINSSDSVPVVKTTKGTFCMTGGALISENDAVPLDTNSTFSGAITIEGTAEVSSLKTAAIRMEAGFVSLGVLTIGGEAAIRGESFAVSFTEMANDYGMNQYWPEVNIDSGYFSCGEDYIPISDTSVVSFPEGYVLDTKESAEKSGYYTLASKESLAETNPETGESYTYQDFDGAASGGYGGGLNQILESAEEYDNSDSSYPEDSWTAFSEAYEAAKAVKTNANANQLEIDYRAAELTKTMQVLDNVTDLDVANLANGTYSMEVDLYKTTMSGPSMASGALNGDAVLEVENGKATMSLNFKPTFTSELWGHLLQFWIYNGDTPAQAEANSADSENDSVRKEAEYSNYYAHIGEDEGTEEIEYRLQQEGVDGESEEYPFPGTVTFKMPYLGTDSEYSTLYCRVGVDAMREIADEGISGDANVLAMLKWSTLEEIDVEPTLQLSTDEISLIQGGSEEVTAKLLSAEGYTINSWSSSDEAVATVSGSGDTGMVTAAGEGECTVTVTASNGDKTLQAEISVTVASKDKTAVKVESVNPEDTHVTVTLTGDVLVTNNAENDKIEVEGSQVVIDGVSGGEGGAAGVTVVIPSGVSQALKEKDTTIQTDLGSISLDSALMAQTAASGKDAELSVETEDATSLTAIGNFSDAYELTLKNADGGDISFGDGSATVTVSCGDKAIYAYCVSGEKLTERLGVMYDSEAKTATWTTKHFSLWALSDREYAVSGSSGGSSGGGSGGGSMGSEFFLEDGNYYVDIDLWKADSNEQSMGHVAFKNNDRALVTVKNGKITTVRIATNPVDVDQYHSAITQFEVDNAQVTVLSTGKVTTKPAGVEYEYIQSVEFQMPSEGQPEYASETTYVPVTFWVPDTPMDAAVGDELPARIKFMWSTATKTNDTSLESNSNTASGTSSITGEDIKNIALTDAATGIKLETNTERLSDKAEMTVSRLTSGSEYDTAVEAMSGVSGTWSLYKIETSVDGKATAPEGSVTLSFPCGEEELTLYRISDSGTKTVLKGSVKDGYYVISTSSLGMFAVMGDISSEIPAEDGAFTDMQSHWAKEYVEAVVERGLFNGTSATAFSPNESMTRAMFVTVIGRLAGVDAEGSAATAFTDVKSDSYYTPYVAWAAENDIVEGTTAATFDPDRAISRQEMAVLLSRYAEFADITLKDGEAVSFADSDEISAYAKDAVEAMAKAGLLNGVGDNRFAPDDTATRAEVAALLARFIEDYSL